MDIEISDAAGGSPKVSHYRLPRNVIPERYRLWIGPDASFATFRGTVEADVVVKEPTKEVVLNAVDLALTTCHIRRMGPEAGRAFLTCDISYDKEHERVTLQFPGELDVGAWTLTMFFTGVINEKLKGFYRTEFGGKRGAMTQFESTDARRAFPCWDEPDLKAYARLILDIPKNSAAISNTPILDEMPLPDGNVLVRFAETKVPISTYLIAWVIGAYDVSQPLQAGSVPLVVWYPRGRNPKLAGYAHAFGARVLEFYETYYSIKLDTFTDVINFIAVPDFAAGAMENLGAITFRERALLVDETQSSHSDRERIADVIAHECAHMWFGDLVTVRWWNGLWLNEAFATYMELFAVDGLEPTWKRWNTFLVERAAVLAICGLRNTRAVEYPVHSPEDAAGMFDLLTYQFGAGILRMLEQYLGAETFRSGVQYYLRAHRAGNAETHDLFDALGHVSGKPVADIMHHWVFTPGMPRVIVSADPQNPARIILRQEKFSYLPRDVEQDPIWQIPVRMYARMKGGAVKDEHVLLAEKEKEIMLSGEPELVIANHEANGVYRVEYDNALAEKICARAAFLSSRNQFMLLNDTWANVEAGRVSITRYLELAEMFCYSRDINVWRELVGSFTILRSMIGQPHIPFEAYVRWFTAPVHLYLGWEAQEHETPLLRQLRSLILRTRCVVGNDLVVQACLRALFDRYKSNPESVDGDLVPVMFRGVGYTATTADFDYLLSLHNNARTPQEEAHVRTALGSVHDPVLIERILKIVLGGKAIRSQDAPYMFRDSFFSEPASRCYAWHMIVTHWDYVLNTYPDNSIVRMFQSLPHFMESQLADEVREFFLTHLLPEGEKTMAQQLEQWEIMLAMKAREEEQLNDYLEKKNYA